MSVSVEDILLGAFFLLPGAYGRIQALRKSPEPWSAAARSPLQEFLDVLLYAIVIGLIAVSTVAVIAVAFFQRGEDAQTLVVSGLGGFTAERRVDGFAWLIAYFFTALVVAELIGSTRLLTRAQALIATVFGIADAFEHVPIWYWALGDTDVPVTVRTKAPGLYRGLMALYPLVEDDKPKDFAIREAVRFHPETGALLEEVGVVLLNSADCTSIEVARQLATTTPLPVTPRDWEHWTRLAAGAVVVMAAVIAFARLTTQPATAVLRLLEFATVLFALTGLLAIVRLEAVASSRWDSEAVQRVWAIGAIVAMLGTFVWLAGAGVIGVSVGVLGAVAVALSPFASALLPDDTP